MRRRYDKLWKSLLNEVFEDMLRFVFPNAEEELDLQRGVELLDKELSEIYPEPEKTSQTRIVDKLAKVYMRSGLERWLLIHIEVQGQNDKHFAKRMFTYYYRIFDRHNQPVTAIALFTGRSGENMQTKFEDHCLGTHILYQYNTFSVSKYSDEELAVSENPFALIMLAAKKALLTGKDLDERLLVHKIGIARLLLKRGIYTERKIRAILVFLNNYLLIENPLLNRIFMEQVDLMTGKTNTMDIVEQLAQIKAEEGEVKGLRKGLRKGFQKGRAEERAKSVKALLTNTRFSVQKIASILSLSVSFVERQKKALHSR